MRIAATEKRLLFVILIAIFGLIRVQPATAAPYCPDSAHAKPSKVPAGLVMAVAKAFGIEDAAVRDAAFVRCAGGKLMGCYIGANLSCGKAETHRVLTGATAWCHENPGSKSIPMSATGHDTVYAWSCSGSRAVAGKGTMTVDPQGYIANNWKEVR
jgi:hypothetical protein